MGRSGLKQINEYIHGLVQERCNSIAKALELRFSCTNPSIYNPINMYTVSLCFALFCLYGCYAWIHMNCHSLHALHWRHNDHDGVSNHQPHDCLLNLLFRRRPKKTSKLRVTGLCVGNSPGPVNSPHKGPVTRKMFPLDDVIMGSFHVTGAIITPVSVKEPRRRRIRSTGTELCTTENDKVRTCA